MKDSSIQYKPSPWMAGILFSILLMTGCAGMKQQGGQRPAPEVVKRDDQLNGYREKGTDYATHRVRPGETLSDIAMAYYDTYLTDVDYYVPKRAYMTPDVSRQYNKKDVRRMGKVSDVIARLNELDSSRLKVGSDIILPRIEGLPFRVRATVSRKPAIQEQPTAPPEPEPAERKPPDDGFQNLLGEGRRQFERNAFAAALAPLSKAHRLRPDNAAARDYLYRSYLAMGEEAFGKKAYLQAMDAFENALTYNGACGPCRKKKALAEAQYKDLHYKNGIRHFENEQLVKAIEEWEMVQKVDPDYQNVRKNIELARRLLKRLGEMEKEKSD